MIVTDEKDLRRELGVKNILRLTLKKKWFDLTVADIKKNEFRRSSEWMNSRLYHKNGSLKEYDLIEFSNGYNSDSPKVLVHYIGFFYAQHDHIVKYGEEKVFVKKGDIVIKFGDIVKRYEKRDSIKYMKS